MVHGWYNPHDVWLMMPKMKGKMDLKHEFWFKAIL